MAIKQGDTVVAHYVGTLSDGTEFDRSAPDSPLTFTMGAGQLIAGFEKAVANHEKGDRLEAHIPPEEAYGLHDAELVFKVPAAQVPEGMSPEPGSMLHVSTDQGELEVAVLGYDEEFLTLDANHPLAGQTLTFNITIADVR